MILLMYVKSAGKVVWGGVWGGACGGACGGAYYGGIVMHSVGESMKDVGV